MIIALNLHERIQIIEMLPQSGTFADMSTGRAALKLLDATEEERAGFEFTDDGGYRYKIGERTDYDLPIDCVGLIKKQCELLDTQASVTNSNYEIIEKFKYI